MKTSKYDQIKRIIKRKMALDKGIWPHMIKDEEVDPMIFEIMKIYEPIGNNKTPH